MEATTPPPDAADREESKEYKKALTLIKAGQLERAREVLEEYIQHNPDSVRAVNKYAYVLVELGKSRPAKQILQSLIARGQRDSYTHFLLGRTFHREGSLQIAIQQYRNALALRPDDIYTINALASALREVGQGASAVALLARGLQISREDPTTFILLADLYLELGDTASAARWIEQGLEAHPNDLKLKCLQAFRKLKAGDISGARSAYEGIARDFPQSAEGRLGIARTLEEEEKLGEALKELAHAAAAEPKNVAVLREQARLFIRTGDPAQALVAMQKAHELEPRDPAVMAELADALIANKLKLKAYMMLKRAVATHNEYHFSHYLIGRLYLDEELYGQARDELEFAHRLQPDFSPTRSALAEALFREGDLAGATEHSDAAQRADPNDRTAKLVKALIERSQGQGAAADKTLALLAKGTDRAAALARAALAKK